MHFVYLDWKWTCLLWAFTIIPSSSLSSTPLYSITSALFAIRHAFTSNQPFHSHPFPLLCLKPNTWTHSPHTRTHTPPPAPLDHVGGNGGLELVEHLPHQSSVLTPNPQHIPHLPLHAGIPLATVVCWCLPSNQQDLSPHDVAPWLVEWGFAAWARWRLIADQRSHVYLVLWSSGPSQEGSMPLCYLFNLTHSFCIRGCHLNVIFKLRLHSCIVHLKWRPVIWRRQCCLFHSE